MTMEEKQREEKKKSFHLLVQFSNSYIRTAEYDKTAEARRLTFQLTLSQGDRGSST